MAWKKLGNIFCPSQNYDWMHTHAAVPVIQHISGDNYRIHFSCRDIQSRSHAAWIQINISNPFELMEIATKPTLSPGKLGAFDDSGVMPTWLLKFDQSFYLYYIGWNLGQTVPFRNSIGLAVSQTGVEYQRYAEGPLLDRNLVDPYFCASCCVLVDQGIWKMWYLSCVDWVIKDSKPQHRYHIKYADSHDGINWNRHGKVAIDFLNPGEYAISRPSVIKDVDCWKMWYSYRGEYYKVGYAESEDGINWVRMDDKAGVDVSRDGWDSEMVEYPMVFDHGGNRFMIYNGNSYGKTGIGLAILE